MSDEQRDTEIEAKPEQKDIPAADPKVAATPVEKPTIGPNMRLMESINAKEGSPEKSANDNDE
jgi:hypothetical protein